MIEVVKQSSMKKNAPSVPKISCYQCYKLFYVKDNEEAKRQAEQLTSSKGLKL